MSSLNSTLRSPVLKSSDLERALLKMEPTIRRANPRHWSSLWTQWCTRPDVERAIHVFAAIRDLHPISLEKRMLELEQLVREREESLMEDIAAGLTEEIRRRDVGNATPVEESREVQSGIDSVTGLPFAILEQVKKIDSQRAVKLIMREIGLDAHSSRQLVEEIVQSS